MKRLCKILLGLVLVCILLGYAQFCYYAQRNTIEWAYQAYDVQLKFGHEDPYQARWIFVGVSDFGQTMITSYINLIDNSENLAINRKPNLLTVAINEELSTKYWYLDFFAYVEAYGLYFWHRIL